MENKEKRKMMYYNFSVKEKQVLRKVLEDKNNIRRQQIEHFENGLIKPLRDDIKLSEKFFKGEITLGIYYDQSMRVSNHIIKFVRGVGK